MSLLIGVPCRGAVVIGADSAAQSGGLFDSTIQQTAKKVRVIQDTAILGVAGPEAVAQRYTGVFGELMVATHTYREKEYRLVDLEPPMFADCIEVNVSAVLDHSFKAANVIRDLVGAENAAKSHLGEALIGICSKGEPTLYATSLTCVTQRVEAGSFETIGSGKRLADPFLAFLRRVLWQKDVPDVEVGELSVVWALRHAIEVNTGGVADPAEIYTLYIDGGIAVVTQLDEVKVKAYDDRIKDIENQMYEYASKLPKNMTQVPIGPDDLSSEIKANTTTREGPVHSG